MSRQMFALVFVVPTLVVTCHADNNPDKKDSLPISFSTSLPFET